MSSRSISGAMFEHEGAAASRVERNEAANVWPGGGASVASEQPPKGQRRLRGFAQSGDPLAVATLDPRRFCNVRALFERSEAGTTRPNQLRLTPLQVRSTTALATLDPRRVCNVAAAPAGQHRSRAALFERSEAETTRPNQPRLTPLQVRSTTALATLNPRRVEARQQ